MRSWFFIFLLCLACSQKTEQSSQDAIARRVFANSISDFEVKVFYEVGAEPYVGDLSLAGPAVWQITEDSYETLFSQHTFGGASRILTIPKTLGAMTSIAPQSLSSWSADQLIALGNTLAADWDQSSKIVLSVIFLHGSFEGNTNILGVHFSNTPFAFVFKDNILSVGGTPTQQKYAEQAVVVHELGHVVGLVNNGVPMVSNHEDAAHPHHTNDTDCVMYWSIESTSNILSSVDNFITLGALNLFGSKVLDDVNAFQP